TLFGRNTPAGVVKFDSARPSQDADGYIRVGYGKVPKVEDRLKGGKLAATIALPDALASWAPLPS
ncbi:hypothetical protein, partial [Stenotrophomonas sp. 3diitr2024]|uniref:hypothetical protein n=1 Tax=Stenotrophomonas sp. 3diitr2024 TaxID=3345115 RepID=UPI0035CB48FC